LLHIPALTLFQHPGVQPFLDEPHDASVGDAVLDKLHQPSLIESIEGNIYTLPITRAFR
jgi:hypothetical protein